MNKLDQPWSDKLRKIDPYVAGEQPENDNILKLNANENPYPPSPKVEAAIKSLDFAKLNLYPDAGVSGLRSSLAAYYNVSKDEIFVGNGSDDVIALSFMAFFNSDKPILFPDVTYSFYKVWCSLFSTPYKTIPVNNSFRINPDEYKGPNGGVIIPNPNAPTSIGEGRDFIVKLLENNRDSIVIIDEAYVDFGDYSAVELIKEYKNLVIIHTFSKSRSMASFRIGIAIADKELIGVLEAVKNSYNSYAVSTISMTAAKASVEDEAYLKESTAKVIATRDKTIKRLEALGFKSLPSSTNFILTAHDRLAARVIFEELKKLGIYVRYFNLPRVDNYLRITVGTDKDMDRLLEGLKNIMI